MSKRYFLVIDGVDGGSNSPLSPGGFELQDFDFNIHKFTGLGQGSEPELSNLNLELLLGTASPKLLEILLSGQTIDSIQIKCFGAEGKLEYDLRLGQVKIANLSDNGLGPGQISFDYEQIHLITTPVDATGKSGTSKEYLWNRESNEAGAAVEVPTAADTGGSTFPKGTRSFLCVEGINGGSTHAAAPGSFELSGFDLGFLADIAGGGQPNASFVVDLLITNGLPQLAEKLANGEQIPSIQIKCISPNGDSVCDIRFGNVTVTHISEKDSSADSVGFGFETIDIRTTPVNADGTLGSTQTFRWDFINSTQAAEVVAPTVPAGMALAPAEGEYFLIIDGLDGGSTSKFAPGAFEVSGFSFDLARAFALGQPAQGQPALGDLFVELELGSVLAEIAQRAADGTEFSSIQLKCVDALGNVTYDLRLENVKISTLSEASNGANGVGFTYDKVQLTTTPTKINGAPGPSSTWSYDKETSQPVATAIAEPQAVSQGNTARAQDPSYFLIIDGVDGGSTNSNAMGAFEIEEFDFSISTFVGSGGQDETLLTPLAVEGILGEALPQLLAMTAEGTVIDSIQIKCITADGKTVYDLRLGNVQIESIASSSGGGESIGFKYEQIDLTTTPVNADGSLGEPRNFLWDKSKNAPGNSVAEPTAADDDVGAGGEGKYYMFVDGVDGGSDSEHAPNSFEIEGFSLNLVKLFSGNVQGNAEFGDLSVDMILNSAMPQLAALAANGTKISAIQFKCISDDGETLYDVRLCNVIISNLADSSTGSDQLSLNYEKIDIRSAPKLANGTFDATKTFQWDVKNNTAGGEIAAPTAANTGTEANPTGTYYLLIDGIDGGSRSALAPGAFELDEFSFNIANAVQQGGGSPSPAMLEDLLIQLDLSHVLTELAQLASDGTVIPAIQIKCLSDDGKTVYDLRLADVTIKSLQESGKGSDTVQFGFGEIEIITTPLDENGTPGTPQVFRWDPDTNSAGDGVTPPMPVFAVPVPYQLAPNDIFITEIFPDLQTQGGSAPFIELFNNGLQPIDLSGGILGFPDQLPGQQTFELPQQILPAGETLILVPPGTDIPAMSELWCIEENLFFELPDFPVPMPIDGIMGLWSEPQLFELDVLGGIDNAGFAIDMGHVMGELAQMEPPGFHSTGIAPHAFDPQYLIDPGDPLITGFFFEPFTPGVDGAGITSGGQVGSAGLVQQTLPHIQLELLNPFTQAEDGFLLVGFTVENFLASGMGEPPSHLPIDLITAETLNPVVQIPPFFDYDLQQPPGTLPGQPNVLKIPIIDDGARDGNEPIQIIPMAPGFTNDISVLQVMDPGQPQVAPQPQHFDIVIQEGAAFDFKFFWEEDSDGDAFTVTNFFPGLLSVPNPGVVADGQHSTTLSLQALENNTIDGDRTVGLTVENNRGKADLHLTVTIRDNDLMNPNLTPIHLIQGSGRQSPLVGQEVWIEGIVTGDFQYNDDDFTRDLGGFSMQTIPGQEDMDPFTSQGIFANDAYSEFPVDVNTGDSVIVHGIVNEFFGRTVVNVMHTFVQSSDNQLPTARLVNPDQLQVVTDGNGQLVYDLNHVVDEVVILPDLIVQENDDVGSRNNAFAGQGPTAMFTEENLPDQGGFADFATPGPGLNIDDGLENDTAGPGTGQPSAVNSFDYTARVGDDAALTIGNAFYGWLGNGTLDTFGIRPIVDGVTRFAPENSRPGNDPRDNANGIYNVDIGDLFGGGSGQPDIFIANFNLDGFPSTEPDDQSAFFEPFIQTQQKIRGQFGELRLDSGEQPDVIVVNGLFGRPNQEPEDDTFLQAVNGSNGGITYESLPFDFGMRPQDSLFSSIYYNPDRIAPGSINSARVIDNQAVDAAGITRSIDLFDGPNANKPTLIASLVDKATGEDFTVISVHGAERTGQANNGPGDADNNDGAGVNNQTRTEGLNALQQILANDPGAGPNALNGSNFLIVGDHNANRFETPLQTLEGQGWTRHDPAGSYNVTEDGYRAMQSPTFLSPNSTFNDILTIPVHFNADESAVNGPGNLFGGDSIFRSSAHDPVLTFLDLDDPVEIYDGNNTDLRIGRFDTVQNGIDFAHQNGFTSIAVQINSAAFFDPNEPILVPIETVVFHSDIPLALNDIRLTGMGQNIGVHDTEFDADLTVRITGSDGNDISLGEENNDTLFGALGDDILLGDEGNDHLEGGQGNDALSGGEGNDVLLGGAGDDSLYGGEGVNILTGGEGRDTFVIEDLLGNTTITDFNLAEDILRAVDFLESKFKSALADAISGSAILTFENGSVLTVQGEGVTPETLALANLELNSSAMENAPVVGRPVVEGTLIEGETLTANINGVTDADGIQAGTHTFQWRRNGVDIPDATGTTFVLRQSDVGDSFAVVFGYIDGAGKQETVMSVGSDPVENFDNPLVGDLTIASNAQVGATITLPIENLSDADGINVSTITYEWNRSDDVAGTNSVVIAGADAQSYTLTGADHGKVITGVFRYLDDFGNAGSRISTPLEVNALPVGEVLFVGALEEGALVTADITAISDADNIVEGSQSYQWLRGTEVIEGATGLTYTPGTLDVNSILGFRLTYVDGFGKTETVETGTAGAIANVNDPALGDLLIEGSHNPGVMLFANSAGISDEDGINLATLSYQWRRADDAAGTNLETITGATDSSYEVTALDAGKFLTVTLRYVDHFGTSEEVISDPLEPNALPIGLPLISGALVEGVTLTADTSLVSDPDGIQSGTEALQWLRNGVEILGETGTTYTLSQIDAGTQISLAYSFTDNDGTPERVVGDASFLIANVNDDPVGPFSVTGVGEVGQVITADASGITDEDGINEATVSFGWRRIDTDGNLDSFISNATNNTYTVTNADLGFYIAPVFSYVDDFGTPEQRENGGVFVDSPASGAVSVTGTAVQGETIVANLSGIVEPDGIAEGSTTYQWQRGGVPIEGTAGQSATYLVTADDVREELSVVVSYADKGGTEVSFTSSAILAVGAPQILEGTPEADTLFGGEGHDTISGLGDDDTLGGNGFDDHIDGGAGIDTAVFLGNQASYTLQVSASGTTIIDRRAPQDGGQGTDVLTSIEFLDFETEIPLFKGNPMYLDIFDNPVNLTAAEFSEITELYVAYFNRAPDAIGLFYWASEIDRGFTLQNMAKSFFEQPETLAVYADALDDEGNLVDVDSFVTAVYNNVLGRGPDADGFAYWVGELINNPNITPPNFILSIIGGAKYPSNPTPQTDLDQAYLASKADLGVYYSAIKGLSNTEDAKDVMALFDGTEAGIQNTVAAIDLLYQDAIDPVDGEFLFQIIGVLDDPFAI